MTKELAEKLREAGFPQLDYLAQFAGMCACACGNQGGCSCGCHNPPEGKIPHVNAAWNDMFGKWIEIPLRFPTLSELIEACGDRLEHLRRCPEVDTHIWWAYEVWKEEGVACGEGDTPEEAVAMLWLKLNPKKDDKIQEET